MNATQLSGIITSPRYPGAREVGHRGRFAPWIMSDGGRASRLQEFQLSTCTRTASIAVTAGNSAGGAREGGGCGETPVEARLSFPQFPTLGERLREKFPLKRPPSKWLENWAPAHFSCRLMTREASGNPKSA